MDNAKQQEIICLADEFIHTNALILDTETTGLLADGGEMVEIAITDAAGALEFWSFVKPSKSIPESATRIHGITDQMVSQAPSPGKLWPTIRAIMFGRHVLAYNAPFDSQILERAFGPSTYTRNWDCLMNMWIEFHGIERYQKLENVCRVIGVEPGGHRALGDAKAAREVLRWLARQEVGE